jgi:hypothetical protein
VQLVQRAHELQSVQCTQLVHILHELQFIKFLQPITIYALGAALAIIASTAVYQRGERGAGCRYSPKRADACAVAVVVSYPHMRYLLVRYM